MKSLKQCLAALSLAGAGLASQAAPIDFSLSASIAMPELAPQPTGVTLHFTVDTPVQAQMQTPGVAYLQAWPVHMSFVGDTSPALDATADIGWFNYESQDYRGIDVRVADFLSSGDMLQLILVLPEAPFSGPETSPTFSQLDLAGLGGLHCYQAPGRVGCASSEFFGDGHYAAAPGHVPEPATALLALSALTLALRLRKGAGKASVPTA